MTFWKRKTYRENKRICGAKGWKEGEMNKQIIEGFYGSETTLYVTIMIGKCHYRFAKTHKMYNPRSEHSCKLLDFE